MADKPSRALVLYGYGLAPFITHSHSHIHTLASRGCCGFLALEHASPPPEEEDEKLVRELAQLLDASEALHSTGREKGSQSEAQNQVPTIAERFMGMKAAIATRNPVIKSFAEKLGFTAVEFYELKEAQSTDVAASELLKLLGFQDGKTLDVDHYDLVFVHIGSHVKENAQNDTEYTNSLVRRILQEVEPGSEIASRLHITLAMSYGAVTEDDPKLSLASLNEGKNSDYSLLFPRQSYTLKGANIRNDIRHQCPMLVAQWQDGVTRKDMAEEFSFSEFRKHSGNLAIPADRVLYEIAFKLWKAPKYGA